MSTESSENQPRRGRDSIAAVDRETVRTDGLLGENAWFRSADSDLGPDSVEAAPHVTTTTTAGEVRYPTARKGV